jgi:hypothetical protein
VRRFLDWLAARTCSWEFALEWKDGVFLEQPVVVRGWWPIHGYAKTRARFFALIGADDPEATKAAPSRQEER